MQHWITAVVALGMMEMSTWYFDYVNFNATGFRPYITTLYAVFLGCVRKTISRVLVLVVSMGFGVVLPYLGAIQNKVSARNVLSSSPFNVCLQPAIQKQAMNHNNTGLPTSSFSMCLVTVLLFMRECNVGLSKSMRLKPS